MKLLYKRILIMFSVALYISVVIMAVIMVFHHSIPSHKYVKIVDIVHRLNLPEAEKNKALDCIRESSTAIEKQDLEIKLARDNIIRLLGKTGPLDKNRLHQLYETANQEERRKNILFEDHVIELRTLLGDEKGLSNSKKA